MTRKIVILGGQGDGVVVAQAVHDIASAGADATLVGFLNDALPKGEFVFGAPVLGTLEDWGSLPEDILFIPALHKVKEMPARAKRIRELQIPGARWTSVVHPTARIAGDATIGCGTFLASYVTVQPGAHIGRFATVRPGAHISHDAVLEDFTFMGSNATLSGRARLKEGAHLGPNSAVRDGMTVGRYAVIGLCSAVTKNIEDFVVCVGVPARPLSVGKGTE